MFFVESKTSLKPDAPSCKPTNKPSPSPSMSLENSNFNFPSAAEMRARTDTKENQFFRKYKKIIYDEIQIAASKGHFNLRININESKQVLNELNTALSTLAKGLRQLGYAVDINVHYSQDPLEHWASKIIDIYAITISWEE